jgi:hypothetical protein
MDAEPNKIQTDRWRNYKWAVLFIFLFLFIPPYPSDKNEYLKVEWQHDAVFILLLCIIFLVFLDIISLLPDDPRSLFHKFKNAIMASTEIYTIILTGLIIYYSKNLLICCLDGLSGIMVLNMLLILHFPTNRYIKMLTIITAIVFAIMLIVTVFVGHQLGMT